MWSVFRAQRSPGENSAWIGVAKPGEPALLGNVYKMEVSCRWRRYFLKRSSKAWRASFERGGAGAAEPVVCA
jgi:hypothetical protein